MTISDFVDDVLMLVLEHVPPSHCHADTAESMRSCMTVSQRWNTMSERVFWRALRFVTVARMDACTRAITLSQDRGKPVQHWIRDLALHIQSPEVPMWSASACALLARTPHLRSLDIAPCALSHLSCAPATLRTLDLHFYPVEPPFADFPLATFPALECLSLCMLHADWTQDVGHALFAPCTLPCLHTLHWQGHPSAGFPRFLAHAHFPALRDAQLRALSPLTNADAVDFGTFLDRHALERLTLALADAADLLRIVPHARAGALMPVCGGRIPPPALVACLPAGTHTLELHHDRGLWPLLSTLARAPPRRLGAVVLLTRAPGRFFSWAPPEDDVDGFALVGRLLGCAIALASRGVDVCDRRGCTIRDCLSAHSASASG